MFFWGMAAWCWGSGDVAGRRLAAVQLVEVGAAFPGEVADAFGVTYEAVRLWRQAYTASGTEGLMRQKLGPRRPRKLTEEVRQEVQVLAERAWGCGRSRGRSASAPPRYARGRGAEPRSGRSPDSRPSGIFTTDRRPAGHIDWSEDNGDSGLLWSQVDCSRRVNTVAAGPARTLGLLLQARYDRQLLVRGTVSGQHGRAAGPLAR